MALDSPEILKDHDCFTQQPAPTEPAKFRFPKQVGEKYHPHIEDIAKISILDSCGETAHSHLD